MGETASGAGAGGGGVAVRELVFEPGVGVVSFDVALGEGAVGVVAGLGAEPESGAVGEGDGERDAVLLGVGAAQQGEDRSAGVFSVGAASGGAVTV